MARRAVPILKWVLVGHVLHLPTGETPDHRPGQPSTALEVAALQLHNDLVRDQAWRRCPRCARVFVRQRGRARYPAAQSHRRDDAIYCSSRCAKAAAQAAYRQRRKALPRRAGEPSGHQPQEGADR